MQKKELLNQVGRPKKPESQKKIQVINYIPKMYANKFKKAIEPLLELYGTVPK